jgi:hypothetical protein
VRTEPLTPSSPPDLGENVLVLPDGELGHLARKWVGRTIETRVSCFYADTQEFHCIVTGGARVDFSDLEPDDARADLEMNCDTLKKSSKSRCTVTVRFIFAGFEKLETGSLVGAITLIKARHDHGVLIAPKRRKAR